MKEPWKKPCNAGKVVITLNDEKATTPTEVEVPVDLNWAPPRCEKSHSAPKAIILVGVLLVLGLTIITLFKVQNLVYTTSYINWRMQELESAVGDSNDDVKLIKYKLSLDERVQAARAEPLIATIGNSKNLDSQDLKLSESQNRKHTTNSLNSESSGELLKNTKADEDQDSNKESLPSNTKTSTTETKDSKDSGVTDLNDTRDHANPNDPEEWIKPLVETFDIFGNQPIEDHFIHNVLMKLLMPENNFEVLEMDKMHDANNAANQEQERPKMILTPLMRNDKERINKPLTMPLDSILMKSLLAPVSNFKIFHFNNDKQAEEQQQQQQQQQQQNSMEQLLPPIEGFLKSFLPPALGPANMKVIRLDGKPMRNPEDDMPKFTIQRMKVKVLPLNRGEFNSRSNVEVVNFHEQEPSQEVEAPKPNMPIPFPIADIMKNLEFIPFGRKQEEQRPFPIPISEIMKTILSAPGQDSEVNYNNDSQDPRRPRVEVIKVPVHAMQDNLPNLPMIPLMQSMQAMQPMQPIHYDESAMSNMNDNQDDVQQQEEQQQQQEQQQPEQQQQQQQQSEPEQQQQPSQSDEVPKETARSTRLSPVPESVPDTWNMQPMQYARVPIPKFV